MPLLIVIIILLLIWGNISRRSASHPINAIVAHTPPIIVCGIHGGVGDTFTGGGSIVSGVCEPHLHCNIAPIIPIHITMPVDPPPIAIQKNPIPAAPILPNGTTIKASGDEVDIIQNGTRRWIPNPATFTAMGLEWNKIKVLTDAQFNAIPKGAMMPDLTPKPVAPKPVPVAPIVSAGGLLWGTSGTAPIAPIRRQPYFCSRGGNGPGWCVDKLDQLANQHCHLGCGCGAF